MDPSRRCIHLRGRSSPTRGRDRLTIFDGLWISANRDGGSAATRERSLARDACPLLRSSKGGFLRAESEICLWRRRGGDGDSCIYLPLLLPFRPCTYACMHVSSSRILRASAVCAPFNPESPCLAMRYFRLACLSHIIFTARSRKVLVPVRLFRDGLRLFGYAECWNSTRNSARREAIVLLMFAFL